MDLDELSHFIGHEVYVPESDGHISTMILMRILEITPEFARIYDLASSCIGESLGVVRFGGAEAQCGLDSEAVGIVPSLIFPTLSAAEAALRPNLDAHPGFQQKSAGGQAVVNGPRRPPAPGFEQGSRRPYGNPAPPFFYTNI